MWIDLNCLVGEDRLLPFELMSPLFYGVLLLYGNPLDSICSLVIVLVRLSTAAGSTI